MQKKLSVVLIVMVLAGMVGLIGLEAQAAEPVTVKGTVQVTRDEDYNATSAKITDGSKNPAVTYNIVLNTKGTDLADAMEGQEAEITGTVAKKGDASWLTVTSYKTIEVTVDDTEVPADGGGDW